VANGFLSITASNYGQNQSCADGNLRQYQSGLINTTGKFNQQYGLFQARLHLLNNSAGGKAVVLLPTTLRWLAILINVTSG
jgi:beta-glucanase (GH16 family)